MARVSLLQLDEFNPSALTTFVSGVETAEFRLSSVFPEEKVYDDEYVFDVIKASANLASKITGFNASAPIRGREGLDQIRGDVTKIQDSLYFDEKDYRHIASPQLGTDQRETRIKKIYGDMGQLVNGVDYMLEYMRAKLVYEGKFKYKNPETQVEVELELERPEGSDIIVANSWDNDDSDPIADLRAALKQYRKQNNQLSPERIDISQEVESALMMSPAIRKAIYGETGVGIVSPDELQAVFAKLQLPPYFVNKDVTAFEVHDTEGKVVKVENEFNMPQDRVVFYSNEQGKTVRGRSIENGLKFGKFVFTDTENNPYRESIIVGEVATPAFTALDSNVTLTVL